MWAGAIFTLATISDVTETDDDITIPVNFTVTGLFERNSTVTVRLALGEWSYVVYAWFAVLFCIANHFCWCKCSDELPNITKYLNICTVQDNPLFIIDTNDVIIANGEVTVSDAGDYSVELVVVGDNIVESDETFTVEIVVSNPLDTPGTTQTFTVSDDDGTYNISYNNSFLLWATRL